MMLSWKIRYLDRADKQFKVRLLHLNAKALDPVTRAAVELAAEDVFKTGREILKYRHLFVEGDEQAALAADPRGWRDGGRLFSLTDYFEDESGKRLSYDEMAQIITGSPSARSIPAGAKQHDIDFMFAQSQPVPLAGVKLTDDETRLLGYFTRDLEEMLNSAFMKDGPGTLSNGGPVPTLETAATDEEIRSFVTIFRRLYMEKEPANFQKAVAAFVKALGNHPNAAWVAGAANEVQNHLAAVVDARPMTGNCTCTFTTKRLIDVYLYTQYAHQPDPKRQQQFADCLKEVGGERVVLTWLFLAELWRCSLEICNIGRTVAGWFKAYCNHHAVKPDVLTSLRDDHAGLGAGEKDEDRRARLFHEKAQQIAEEMWRQAGSPTGGPSQFFSTASEQLKKRLRDGGSS